MNTRQVCSILMCALAWLLISPGYTAEGCERGVARIISVQGRVEVIHTGKPLWRRVKLEETLCAGDRVRIEARSRAAILLANQTILRLDEGSVITFSKIEPDKPSWLELLKGAVHFISRVPHSLKIKTPFVNAGVEGTEFFVRVGAAKTEILVFEGRVRVSNAAGNLLIANGQAAVAEAGKAPVRRIIVKPREAVQWALYYPPIIDYRQFSNMTGPDAEALRESITLYRRNDIAGALALLDAVPSNLRNADYFTLRAAMLLSVGRVDEAEPDITHALDLDPENGTAYALQSIIAVTQNEEDKALQLARRAVNLSPQSSVPQIALSYAYQALFNIDKALESVQKAVEISPHDALAWARIAELQLSLGDLDRALAAARKAADLDPDLARTQSVLGFANLLRIDIQEAQTAFKKAIEFDSAAPLPRLGLGLATIRRGNLDEGIKQIEIAASLDPDNALIRSYLGKAYFDQKRDKLAAVEFATAKTLDPNDPTAYFYDAIHKQTTNRPVEALRDLQQAIELNNNRAVYRSRLLLDQDLAARSASLGRVYRDLGFEQLGLVEGWKSVNTDPGNHSAHRLLADNYTALSRHEIARVSELLQSQLLQPINITPIQPQLAESNLLILDGLGPADPSFNEFNPLFARNRFTFQLSGIYGSNDTWGNEATHSGLWNKYSYSIGQYHQETSGFRENNEVKTDIYNVFVQTEFSPKVSVQAEYRRGETKHGDLAFNFDLDAFDPTFKRKERTDTIRVGARFAPRVHSDFIASVSYRDAEDKQEFEEFISEADTEGYIAEAQYLFQSRHVKAEVGSGYYDVTSKGVFGVDEFDTQHSNIYAYSHIIYPSQLIWTVGASLDLLDDGFLGDFNRLNPKFGLILNFNPSTTVRLAAFRVLKRTLVADQTIEPTQVAGFNQFFDDPDATESKRFGIAIDHKFSGRLYGGIEASKRRLKVPIGTIVGKSDLFKSEEELYRAYINWTPHQSVAAAVAYEREDYDSDQLSSFIPSTDTRFLPITLTYFHPTGLFTKLITTYVNQEVKLSDESGKKDEFVLVDAALGYRLPKRRGIVSIGVKNLFDEKFRFQGLGFRTSRPLEETPPFLPERILFVRATISF